MHAVRKVSPESLTDWRLAAVPCFSHVWCCSLSFYRGSIEVYYAQFAKATPMCGKSKHFRYIFRNLQKIKNLKRTMSVS